MDILRRNTDYALRMMINLASHYEQEPISTRALAEQEDVPYQLACKLMQRLGKAGFTTSVMGARGGYSLARHPSKLSLLEVIEVIQGPIRLNRCLVSEKACARQKTCPVNPRLLQLQSQLRDYLGGITLCELAGCRDSSSGRKRRKSERAYA